MLPAPKKEEIDHRTLKLLVGLMALSLGSLTSFFASSKIESISASYCEGGWSQSIFVGFLFAIAAFLLAYNGLSRSEMLMSKFAAVAALGVALFPTSCKGQPEIIPYVHFGSALRNCNHCFHSDNGVRQGYWRSYKFQDSALSLLR